MMTLQDKEKEISQINKKLAVMGSKELLIVHTTITALYNRQQLDLCEQSLQEQMQKPAAADKALVSKYCERG